MSALREARAAEARAVAGYYLADHSAGECAAKFDISISGVYRRLVRAGVERRSHMDARRIVCQIPRTRFAIYEAVDGAWKLESAGECDGTLMFAQSLGEGFAGPRLAIVYEVETKRPVFNVIGRDRSSFTVYASTGVALSHGDLSPAGHRKTARRSRPPKEWTPVLDDRQHHRSV